MPTNRPYPIFLNLTDRPVLIVGGGAIGLRKAQGLTEAGARITCVSPSFAEGFDDLPFVCRVKGLFRAKMLERETFRLIFACTDDSKVNAQVYADAIQRGILCTRADIATQNDFTNGATSYIADTTISVSTNGASPTLATRIRQQAVAGIDPILPELAALNVEWRVEIRKNLPDAATRKELVLRLAGPEMEARLRKSGKDGAQLLFREWMREQLAANPDAFIGKSDSSSRLDKHSAQGESHAH